MCPLFFRSLLRETPSLLHCTSESAFFVSPHRLILKTCGTTLNLLGLPRILEIAREQAGLPNVYQCFYSRKAFMFPDRQSGPHRDWKAEVEYLDNIFPNGAAYTVGKVNGDHWLLYITTPGEDCNGRTAQNSPVLHTHTLPPVEGEASGNTLPDSPTQDYTIEILMQNLSASSREPFLTPDISLDAPEDTPSVHALALSSSLGITDLFPTEFTTLDAYSFTPCGYSSNALVRWREDAGSDLSQNGEGYYTIHVTPEEGWSYASFECNIPLPTHSPSSHSRIPDLKTLIRRIVNIFQPGKLTLTLFISSEENATVEEEGGETAVERAQRAFKAALTLPSCCEKDSGTKEDGRAFNGLYRRTDKINYEFGGYDLAFASFELRS